MSELALSLQDVQALVKTVKRLRSKVEDLEKRLQEVEEEPRIIRQFGGGVRDFKYLQGTIADAQTPNTLLTDGSRKAKIINIDAETGTWDKIVSSKAVIKFHRTADGFVYIYKSNQSDLGGILCGEVYLINFRPSGDIANFLTGTGVNKQIKFIGHDGTFNTEVARVQNTGDNPLFEISRSGDILMLDQKIQKLGTFTDAQRLAAGTVGRWIFNTDDGMPNYDDGVNWRDINGNIT